MTVIARFKVESLNPCSDDHVIVKLRAHTGPGSEDFAKYTPWGEMSMGITKGSKALEELQVDKLYEVSFKEVI